MILLFQPYYSRLGHFKPYTDKISSYLKKHSIDAKTILGIHTDVELGHSGNLNVPTYGKGRFSLIALTLKCYIALYNELKGNRVKTVHILDYEIILLYLMLLFLGKKARHFNWCITVHSINFLTKKNIILSPYQLLAKLAYRKLDSLNFIFFCNGRNSSTFLSTNYGLKKANIHITGWGFDSNPKAITSKKSNSILLLGVIRKDKNLEFALSQLSKISDPFNFIIAGFPQDYSIEEINYLVQFHNLSKKTSLDLAYLSQDKMDYYLETSEFILIPYDKSNVSNSGPLMDGIANSCIPIVSAYGERKHIVESLGLSTFTFDSNQNTLCNLLSSFLTMPKIEKDKIRTSIQKNATQFSWDSIFKVYQSHY